MAQILVVDDSSFSRKATIKILSLLGYETIAADSGEECLKMINDCSPACVILDLLMPGMSGNEILKKLKTDYPHIPVIVQTSDIQESVRKECLDQGAAAFLNKPPQNDELSEAIKKAIQGMR